MGLTHDVTCSSSRFSARAMDLETTLQQTLEKFKELRINIEQMESKLQSCEAELSKQHEICKSQMCSSSETYKTTIEFKDNIIQQAVSTVIKLNETKNLNLLTQLLRILCGESNIEILTPPKETQENKENISKPILSTPKKKQLQSEKASNSPMKKRNILSPKKEINLSETSAKDESISEIDGTPGRTSPIIPSRKLKSSSSSISTSGSSTEFRDKKKCPTDWISSEAKQIKLSQPSPNRNGKTSTNGRLRQSRLSYNKLKTCSVVDLTCSPDTDGAGSGLDVTTVGPNPHVQLLIKKESSDNDDTILPSPTSGPANVALTRPALKDSQKSNRKLSLIKKMEEADDINSPIIQVVQKKTTHDDDVAMEPLEESINILKPNRFAKTPNKLLIKMEQSPAKFKSPMKENPPIIFKIKLEQPKSEPAPMEEDVTHCEEASVSLLQHVNKMEQVHTSPTKQPLSENMNAVNVAIEQDSMSVLPQETVNNNAVDNHKSKTPEKVEPIYKEPTVRKKAEKLALPGWCCEECVNFFKDLYGNDPAKIAIIVSRCSKHRGRTNPARPATPAGFWYPRWDVPANTEEFNRRNNAE